jgi:predicted GIY-YIG superfamily endonuclease
MHGSEKRIVYIIRSDVDPSRHYVGITNDLRSRLEWHNHGPCGHTMSHRPWSVVVSLEFPTEKEAVRFEKYLKSGSGRAFATRHFCRFSEGRDLTFSKPIPPDLSNRLSTRRAASGCPNHPISVQTFASVQVIEEPAGARRP